MSMTTVTRRWISLALFAVAVLLGLAGCSSMSTTPTGGGASGYGANADLLPQRPATPNDAASTPLSVPMAVLVRASAADATSLTLAISKVELQYTEKNKDKDKLLWYTLADSKTLKKMALPPLPLQVSTKGAIDLLSCGQVPTKDYSAIRLSFEKGTSFTLKQTAMPLALETTTFTLSKWTLDPKITNVITLTLDGTKVVAATDSSAAKLAASAVSISNGIAAGSISGKLTPAAGAAKIEAFWGESKVAMANAVAKTDDGTFTIANLPPGPYHLTITATGYHPTTALKPTTVETTTTDLGAIAMTADSITTAHN